MSLNKSVGNMYEWVTHTHSHLRGKCPHECSYCYVQAHERRWSSGAFAGPVRLKEDEFRVKYPAGSVVFVEHQNDLFAEGVDAETICRVLDHCCQYPEAEYVFQTKNPNCLAHCFMHRLPKRCMIGTTIETNRWFPQMGKAPAPVARHLAMLHIRLRHPGVKLFCTIEPIMRFDLSEMVKIAEWQPDFVNIGADSKGNHLPEPTREEVLALAAALTERGIQVRRKSNLERLVG